MRSNVRPWIGSVLAVVAVLALSVVGGAGSAQAAPSSNPFAGSWTGTFTARDFEGVGTVHWDITSSGKLTGTFFNTTVGAGGTMVGYVEKGGTIHLIANSDGGGGSSGEPHKGMAYLDGDGNLVANTTGVWHGGYRVSATLTLD
jgi:hypothetical protein